MTSDVGIVGAGFAGLAAALTLRRHRHSVTVFGGGPCRNASAGEVHGYLGVPDASGFELWRRASDQARAVGATIEGARITDVQADGPDFGVFSDDGRQWRFQRLLLATGVEDAYPDIDNFFDFFGKAVFNCPHCDGYEVRDKPVAIVGWSEATLPFAKELTQWTNQITVVTDGRAPRLSDGMRAELASRDIQVVTETVRHFEGNDGQLSALRFADGSALPVQAAFFNIAHDFKSELAKHLGCAVSEEGAIQVDKNMRTNVERVWAAGDVTGEEQLVSVAAAQGVTAGIDIYRSLPLRDGEPKPSAAEV